MSDTAASYGTLALVGGGEWQDGASFDQELLERSDGEVLVVPTAAAYERPDRAVAAAKAWFEPMGASVRAAMVLGRTDAEERSYAEMIGAARFIYLAGGSPLHLRSVLKDSLVLHALIEAWRSGAVIAGSSAGAMVLTDPMVDPRGGAFTVGLGLVSNIAVVPHYEGEMTSQLRRTLSLVPGDCTLVALGAQAAVIREPDGSWRRAGRDLVTVFDGGREAGLEALAGKPTL